VLAVAVGGRAAETRRDDQRAVLPDDADHVAQHLALPHFAPASSSVFEKP
jgi:hypothetical protein